MDSNQAIRGMVDQLKEEVQLERKVAICPGRGWVREARPN
jgi:hypothetical protein